MKYVIAFILTLVASYANALMPESGWYWNPTESGRGFNIEIQGNQLFVATFVYDQSTGVPTWYSASGTMSSTTSWTAPLLKFQNGQCLTCSYQPPTLAGSIGDIKISFTSASTAVVTFQGKNINVTRFSFGVIDAPPYTILGE